MLVLQRGEREPLALQNQAVYSDLERVKVSIHFWHSLNRLQLHTAARVILADNNTWNTIRMKNNRNSPSPSSQLLPFKFNSMIFKLINDLLQFNRQTAQ